jgi:hypothetical protein
MNQNGKFNASNIYLRGEYEHNEYDVRLRRLVVLGNEYDGALLGCHYSPGGLGRA